MNKPTENEIKEYLQNELAEYLLHKSYGLTKQKKKELREWVGGGNSVYENPYKICDGSGREMNYIDAIEFYEEFGNYFREQQAFEQAYCMDVEEGSCQHF